MYRVLKRSKKAVVAGLAVLAMTGAVELATPAVASAATSDCARTSRGNWWWPTVYMDVPSHCSWGTYRLWVLCGAGTSWYSSADARPGSSTNVACWGAGVKGWHVDYLG